MGGFYICFLASGAEIKGSREVKVNPEESGRQPAQRDEELCIFDWINQRGLLAKAFLMYPVQQELLEQNYVILSIVSSRQSI